MTGNIQKPNSVQGVKFKKTVFLISDQVNINLIFKCHFVRIEKYI